MDVDALVEQLLAQGMTEQQIADLVAQQVIRSRGGRLVDDEDQASESTAKSNNAGDNAGDSGTAPSSDASSSLAPRDQPGVAEIVAEVAEKLDRASVDPHIIYSEAAVTASVLMLQERFSGPMPPPNLARQYETILPGFTDRCLAIHENNSQSMRETVAQNDRRLDRGQLFALIFALACLLCGLGFAARGYPAAGAAVSTTTLVSVVGAFLYSKKTRRKKRRRKSLTQRSEAPERDRADTPHDSQDSIDEDSHDGPER